MTVTTRGQDARRVSPVIDMPAPDANSRHVSKTTSQLQAEETTFRESIVLWRRPVTTLHYCGRECLDLFVEYSFLLARYRFSLLFLALFVGIGVVVCRTEGDHQVGLAAAYTALAYWFWWVGLGILSSVGLGTGLHTFLLYLGPFIARATLAAYECNSVDFPEPPYPDDIVCPDIEGTTAISIWTIMSKVRLEAVLWGAGTAIGELPPYFMARAARLTGGVEEDDEYSELEELIKQRDTDPSTLSLFNRAKVALHLLVQRVGFWGILLAASIPNPLFDLAGITCGHFLVPFWTFFGATLIGKAIVKMHIQKLFVIVMFSAHHVEWLISVLATIPVIGKKLQKPFSDYINNQKMKLHHVQKTSDAPSANWLGFVFEKLVLVMVVYFVLSIINSMAQAYHKRKCARDHAFHKHH